MALPRLTFLTSACGLIRARIAAGEITWQYLAVNESGARQWADLRPDLLSWLPVDLAAQADRIAADHVAAANADWAAEYEEYRAGFPAGLLPSVHRPT